GKMVLLARAYGALFRRTSTFALTIVLGAVLFERAFDQGADALFEQLNQGKLWKHIKHKYET
ncbi:QCR9 protein, partial [Nothocercus nigrocapillus]|nr:QCR9 protein [Nothocercus nigrocapillus]